MLDEVQARDAMLLKDHGVSECFHDEQDHNKFCEC